MALSDHALNPQFVGSSASQYRAWLTWFLMCWVRHFRFPVALSTGAMWSKYHSRASSKLVSRVLRSST